MTRTGVSCNGPPLAGRGRSTVCRYELDTLDDNQVEISARRAPYEKLPAMTLMPP